MDFKMCQEPTLYVLKLTIKTLVYPSRARIPSEDNKLIQSSAEKIRVDPARSMSGSSKKWFPNSMQDYVQNPLCSRKKKIMK